MAIILVMIAYKAQDDIVEGYEWTTGLDVRPVTFARTIYSLARSGLMQTVRYGAMKDEADDLERRVLTG